jgi:hypothetical protein
MVPDVLSALIDRVAPEPERLAFLLGLIAEAERESDPAAVGPVRQLLRESVPALATLLHDAADPASPLFAARDALLYLAGQLPEDGPVLGAAVADAFGPDASATRALQGAFALATSQPRRAQAILAYLGAEAAHRAGPDRESLLQRTLACPACRGVLRFERDGIDCAGCGASYAWQGDVPSLVRSADSTADQFPSARVAEYETGTRPRFVRVMTADFDGVITPEAEARYLQQWLRPREGPVLDLACGAGGWTTMVADIAGADRVIALDFSVAMLEAVGTRLPRVARVHGSASALPVRDAVLGGVNCSDALQALPDPAAAVREVARTLAPGAPFTCFTVLDGPPAYAYFQARFPDHARTRFTTDGLATMLTDAGLHIVDLVRVGCGVFLAARKP